MESSLRGAQRRSNPENVGALRSPGLLRHRAPLDALWLAMTIAGDPNANCPRRPPGYPSAAGLLRHRAPLDALWLAMTIAGDPNANCPRRPPGYPSAATKLSITNFRPA